MIYFYSHYRHVGNRLSLFHGKLGIADVLDFLMNGYNKEIFNTLGDVTIKLLDEFYNIIHRQ
jgi:hypothetical protein